MAFEDFFAARNRRLLELAWLITRDPEDARDAVQDALAGTFTAAGACCRPGTSSSPTSTAVW